MGTKKLRLIYFNYFFIYVLLGCQSIINKTNAIDVFYTTTNASWDAIRIPLFRPYELIKLNGSKEWDMNLQETPGSVSNVREINVIQETITIHSGETHCNGALVKEAWFIIIPEKHCEKGFYKIDGFLIYASSLKIHDPIL